MLGGRISSQSEVIRAIVSGYSPCCGVPHRTALARLLSCSVSQSRSSSFSSAVNFVTDDSGLGNH